MSQCLLLDGIDGPAGSTHTDWLLRWASLPHSLEWGWGAAAPASLLRNVLLSLLPVPFLSHPHYKDFVIN